MVQVETVSTAGEVEIFPEVVRGQAVVGRVIDSAEGKGRTQPSGFGRMVVDDVENHLDARIVEKVDHRLEFAQIAFRHIARMRGEEADGIVAPIIPEPSLDQLVLVDESMNGQELDGGDSQTLQVFDDRQYGHSAERAAQMFRHVGVTHGEPAQMGFVNDRLVPRGLRVGILAPGETGIHDTTLVCVAGAVPFVEREVLLGVADLVAEDRIVPDDPPGQRLRVGIDQELVVVEPVAVFRVVRPVNAISV